MRARRNSQVQPDEQKRLPSANEFSPNQVDLRRVLELANADAGNRAAIVEAIRAEYYSASAARRATAEERLEQQQKRANNVLIGMKEYGLFDLSTNQLTTFGDELLVIADDPTRYARFARHILAECHGIEVLDAVQALQSRDERPTKEALHRELETRGFKLSTATTDHTSLLNWLGPAGIVKGTKREVDDAALGALTGVTLKTLEEWAGLNREQRAVLRTLRRLGDVHGVELMSAQDVIAQSKYEHGSIFREDQLAARVFRPLMEAGWLTREVGSSGRGGKSGRIGATEKLLAVDLDLIPTDDGWGIPPELRPKLNTSLAEIQENLKSSDKNIKGIALELLALRIATDSSLTPLRFRLRAAQTSGAEVDLVAEGVHLHFSRWLFQCKNTKRVDIADAAKEVGMAVLLRVHVIVLVTTGRFSDTVQTYARDIMDLQPLQIVMIDGDVLAKYRAGGVGELMDFLHHEATETMRLKRRHIVSEFEHGIADDEG
jgi:hypothetical protein